MVVVDGLSAGAVQAHAAPVLGALDARRCRPPMDWRRAPVIVVCQGRGAMGDAIAARWVHAGAHWC